MCPLFNQPENLWSGYEIHLCAWLFWCVFMSANASGTSVRVHVDVRECVCVFAAAVQGCSKHAGKPVTANQARGNHPSAQRREPTIPHFLCLSPFLHYSLDLFFSLSHSFIKPHIYSSFYSLEKRQKMRHLTILQSFPQSITLISTSYVFFLSFITF